MQNEYGINWNNMMLHMFETGMLPWTFVPRVRLAVSQLLSDQERKDENDETFEHEYPESSDEVQPLDLSLKVDPRRFVDRDSPNSRNLFVGGVANSPQAPTSPHHSAGILSGDPGELEETKWSLEMSAQRANQRALTKRSLQIHVVHFWSPFKRFSLCFLEIPADHVQQIKLLAERKREMQGFFNDFRKGHHESRVYNSAIWSSEMAENERELIAPAPTAPIATTETKKKRKLLTLYQQSKLHDQFSRNQRPTAACYESLAKKLDMELATVKTWFTKG